MKKNIIAASCAVSLLMSGCVDLTQEPRSFLTPNTVVYDLKTIEVTANGLYNDLWYNNYGYNCRNQILGVGADDIVCGTATKRYMQIDELNVTTGLHDQDTQYMWQNMYKVIRSANSMIRDVAASEDVTEEEKNPYLGEAYFMRAFAYFTLVRYFGPIPLFTDPDFTTDIYGNEQGSVVRAEVEDVYDKIIVPDLQQAEELLPERARTNDNSRAGRAAAKACLADVYLTMAGWPLHRTECYELARDKAKEIIDHTETKAYQLIDHYEDLWKEATKADDTEHIFALNHDATNDTASNYGRSYYASEESSSAWADYLADSCFYERYPDDERRDFNFITTFTVEGTPRPVSYKQTSMRSPAINKYRDYTPLDATGKVIMTAQTNGITPIYRYAEVLLMYAEAQNEVSGPDNLAYQCLNDIRRRAAGGGSYTDASGLSRDDFRTAVFDEYGWEFFAEFKRWFYLVRTEKVLDANMGNPRVKAAIETAGLSGKDPKTYCWMPLPVQEVQLCHFEQNER